MQTTFGVDDVLRAQNAEEESRVMDVEQLPVLGILSQTVIRSPLVHWILPVKFRGPQIHDVAFIGVSESPSSSVSLKLAFIHSLWKIDSVL